MIRYKQHEIKSACKHKAAYYKSNTFKNKQKKMKTIIIKGMHSEDDRQPTYSLYAHGELDQLWGYDLVTAYKWGVFMEDVEGGIYDAKFICPDNSVVPAKVFIWKKYAFKNKNRMQGLIVKVGDDVFMQDAQDKYDRKQEDI